MKSALILITLILLTLIPSNSYRADSSEPIIQTDSSDQPPLIFGAHLRGNRLIVEGANFDRRAVIRVNERRQKTLSDPYSQATMLVARKGGKKIKFDDFRQTIEVQNGSRLRSNPVHLYRAASFTARLIVFGQSPANIFVHLKSGEYLLIDSRSLPSADNFEPAFLQQVLDSPFDTNDLRLYKVISSGDTFFMATQELPVGSEVPPVVLHMAIHIE
jgi:hypothetical protein